MGAHKLKGDKNAYGYVCLNGWTDCAESGYISIAELLENGAELDLYWAPQTLGEIKASLERKAASPLPRWQAGQSAGKELI